MEKYGRSNHYANQIKTPRKNIDIYMHVILLTVNVSCELFLQIILYVTKMQVQLQSVMSVIQFWLSRSRFKLLDQDQDFENANPFIEILSRLRKCLSVYQDQDQHFENANIFIDTEIETKK